MLGETPYVYPLMSFPGSLGNSAVIVTPTVNTEKTGVWIYSREERGGHVCSAGWWFSAAFVFRAEAWGEEEHLCWLLGRWPWWPQRRLNSTSAARSVGWKPAPPTGWPSSFVQFARWHPRHGPAAPGGGGGGVPQLAGDHRALLLPLRNHRDDRVWEPAGHGGALQGPTPAVSQQCFQRCC